MSTLKVDGIRSNSATSDAITLASDGTCTANITNNLSNRNLLINGAMNVAQRGTSTTSDGYKFLDRWQTSAGNLSTGQNVVRSQQSLSSSDTGPFEAGFRKYARIATGAAGTLAANSYLDFYHHIEAQNIANSGWNYTSASSYITVSFWLRCSTNQTFYLFLRSRDGTNQSYVTPITASANNTWTKITKTIPGNSNLQFDDNNGSGLTLSFFIYNGTDATSSSKTINTWAARVSGADSPDMATTWLTAGASTFDITGVQLEVSDFATSFEHKSFADEKRACSRYYQKIINTADSRPFGVGNIDGTTQAQIYVSLPVEMRSAPSSMELDSNSTDFRMRVRTSVTCTGHNFFGAGPSNVFLEIAVSTGHGFTDGQAAFAINNGANKFIAFSAEL